MNIEMNFLSDWQDIMIRDMTAEGFQFSSITSKDLLVIRYFTYLRKKGGQTPRPRRVHKSKEFVCPVAVHLPWRKEDGFFLPIVTEGLNNDCHMPKYVVMTIN